MQLAVWFLKGIIIWMSTGADDVLAMYAIIYDKIKTEQLKAVIGNILGTVLMFIVAAFISHSVLSIVGQSKSFCLLGLVPCFLGWRLIGRNLSIEEKEETHHDVNRWRSMVILAMAIYLTNSTDDLSVNSAVLIQTADWRLVVSLLLGNVTGCIICTLVTMYLCNHIQPKHQRRISMAAGFLLIAIGISVIVKAL